MNHNPTIKYKRCSSVCVDALNALRSTLYALRAFTLVELMVVVAIISILAGLLLPNIRIMREKAWSANCQNNLRQYGVAMKQYMSSGSRGIGSGGAGFNINTDEKRYTGGILARGASAASAIVGAPIFYNIVGYIPGGVTIQSLSDGQASLRVCPAVIQQIRREGNFFDPNSPNFKGSRDYTDEDGDTFMMADFEAGWIVTTNLLNEGDTGDTGESDTNSGYDVNGQLILSSLFSTYAVNPRWVNQYKSIIPENVIAYIDWNARDGWGANLGNMINPNATWAFNGTNSQGDVVVQGTPKWTNACWLTEVGFHHRIGNECGANYVAMDGHVAWISSNAITVTNFTTGM